jgi:hypothetical protein
MRIPMLCCTCFNGFQGLSRRLTVSPKELRTVPGWSVDIPGEACKITLHASILLPSIKQPTNCKSMWTDFHLPQKLKLTTHLLAALSLCAPTSAHLLIRHASVYIWLGPDAPPHVETHEEAFNAGINHRIKTFKGIPALLSSDA